MRVLLLHPHNPLEGYHYPVPQVAFGYLAHELKKAGILDVHVKDAMLYRMGPEEVAAYIDELKPDVLGLRVWSHQVKVAEGYVTRAKARRPGLVAVIGGPHVTTDSSYFSRPNPFDYGVAGEAEEGFTALAKALKSGSRDFSAAPGLVWRENGSIKQNPFSKVDDLDRFGLDWESLDLARYHAGVAKTTAYDHGRRKNAFLFMTRGCPYPCTYCAAGLTNGKKIRSHSASFVLDQIEHLYSSYGVRHFNLMDDNFTFYKEIVMEFCDEFERRRSRLPGVSFHNPNGVRVDRLDREMLQRMKACGWRWLHIGVESGSEVTLKRMKKRLDLKLAAENIGLIREQGLKCWGFFILGYKGEAAPEIEETIRWAVNSRLHAATFSLFSPIPGTEVFRELAATGEIPPDYLMTSYMSPKAKVWASGLTPDELLRYQRQALVRFYARPDRAYHLLRDMSPATVLNRAKQLFFQS